MTLQASSYLNVLSNPVELWSVVRLTKITLLLVAAVAVAGAMIFLSDAPLRKRSLPRSAALEWPFRPSVAADIVEKYVKADVISDVLRGIALDTFIFIPSYVALLVIACFWAARSLAEPWSIVGLTFAWAGVVTGGLDLIENAGMVAELLLRWTFAAPLTAIVCRLKWTLGVVILTYAIGAPWFLRPR